MNSSPLITVTHLTKRFKGLHTPALDDISLAIHPGYVTGLVGPDGAGKTTLIRHIIGLMHPDSGEISVNGFSTQNNANVVHAISGYMPQRFGLYEDLTVLENLNLYAGLRLIEENNREEIFKKILYFTKLEPFQSRLASKLSGGMKQKLGLACALMGDPQILLLDEPSVGVDPISRRELWNMVQELVKESRIVLWATAYLDEAEKCGRVILLNEGKKLYDGSPQEFIGAIKKRTWNISGIPMVDRRKIVRELHQTPSVMDVTISGKNIRVLLKEGMDPLHFPGIWKSVSPIFEDAFMDRLDGFCKGHSPFSDMLVHKKDDGNPVIVADHLHKNFGSFVAVVDQSFTIKRGEIFGLLGPNGAGKSTTFKMMCGLLTPTRGEAFLMGYSLQKTPSEARAKLGYMAQKFSLYGNLNIVQNLNFFSGLYGLSGKYQKEKVEMMIDIFHFQEHLKMNANSLPLGFKQRLALACAVMHEPDILFLDEPTSGVDPITRREFWFHINAMLEKGVTVMVTTHFMDEAEYCDRIALMYRGKSIAIGTPDDLKNMTHDPQGHSSLENAFIDLVEKSEAQYKKEAGLYEKI